MYYPGCCALFNSCKLMFLHSTSPNFAFGSFVLILFILGFFNVSHTDRSDQLAAKYNPTEKLECLARTKKRFAVLFYCGADFSNSHIPFLHYECKRLQTQPAGLNTKKTPAQAHLSPKS